MKLVTEKSEHPTLVRGLSLTGAISLVIGTMIGTGIFLKAAVMTQILGSSYSVLAAWVIAGLLSLAGALTYAEIGGLFPETGGEYVYLKRAYGPLLSFLYGWMRFWIGGPGSIAAYSVGAATFLSSIFEVKSESFLITTALGFIIFFTTLSCLSVSIGGKILTLITGAKLFMILSLPFFIFFFSKTGSWTHLNESTGQHFEWSSFFNALISALWAYDGWNNLAMMSGEIKDPSKNIPRSLIIGTMIVLIVYTFSNLSYFYALPISEVISSSSQQFPQAVPVATKAAQTFLSPEILVFFSLLLVISALGAMNGSMISAARVPYAQAVDGLFPKFLSMVHAKTHVPIASVIAQGVISMVLALSGSFDQLTDYVIFASWIFYALVGISVFIFRKKLPNHPRPYKTLGYPFIPVLFVTLAIVLVFNSLIFSFKESMIGFFLIGLGIPIYFIFYQRS